MSANSQSETENSGRNTSRFGGIQKSAEKDGLGFPEPSLAEPSTFVDSQSHMFLDGNSAIGNTELLNKNQ